MFSVITCYQLMDECSVFLMSVIAILNLKYYDSRYVKTAFHAQPGSVSAVCATKIISPI